MVKPVAPRTPGGKAKKDDGSVKKTPKVNKENEDGPVKNFGLCHGAVSKIRSFDNQLTQYSWTKPENQHITDSLLTLIEDTVVWKGAFGFDNGVEKDTTPTGKGKNIIEHCAGIAKALFTTGEKDSDYMNADLVHLWGVVKN
jgi:hypothetical protein